MQISRLELERFIQEYKTYSKDNDEATFYFTNRDYLERNGVKLDVLDVIEKLVDMEVEQEKIEKILTVLDIEVV